MKRQGDADELLAETLDIVSQIEVFYERARSDEEKTEVSKPKIKSCLEHLRSVLDYIAVDLSESACSKPPAKRVYFPYGATHKEFSQSVVRNLPGLDVKYIPVLESIQPHKTGSDWLIKLCGAVNDNKHKGLDKQVRRSSANAKSSMGGGLINGEGAFGLVIGRLVVDGVLINPGGPINFSSDLPVKDIRSQVVEWFGVSREYEFVEFLMSGSGEDALRFLTKAIAEIEAFKNAIYAV